MGRPAGVANKLTRAAKEAFGLAFEGVGGVDGLIAWAQDNRTEFYKLYARLIPTEVNATVTDKTDPAQLTREELAERAASIIAGVGSSGTAGAGRPN